MGVSYSDNKSKAVLLNDYFCAQATTPTPPEGFCLPPLHFKTQSRLTSISFTPQEVCTVLKNLDTTKAVGPDKISNRILRNLAQFICYPLCLIFNSSLSSGLFPSSWKLANVSPIHKKNDRQNKSNYRPISLLSCIAKVFERLVFNVLFNYCKINNLLTERNSGFKPLDSTVNQLISLVNMIYKGLDDEKEICMIFLDISKAFDKVFHNGLLFKLEQFGIGGTLLKWFKSYLTNRQQRVIIGGENSDFKSLNAGVPQGSVLGPLLFLIFINDICDSLESDPFLFADDTSLGKLITDPINTFSLLNRDLQTISTWAQQWLVTFNGDKTEYMIFSYKRTETIYPPLLFNGIQIKKVNEHTHLGLTLTTNMSWASHVRQITTKAHSRIDMLKRIKNKIPRHTMITLYKSMVRPVLEYASPLLITAQLLIP